MRYAPDEDAEEPPHLKRLRRMVMVLLVVLMLGIVTIAATIVIRLGFSAPAPAAPPVSAESLTLPAEGEIIAVSQSGGRVMFVLRAPDGSETLHVLDAATGAEESRTPIVRE